MSSGDCVSTGPCPYMRVTSHHLPLSPFHGPELTHDPALGSEQQNRRNWGFWMTLW